MKKVRCVDDNMFEKWLTKGKEYEVIQEESEHYCIKDDEGHNLWYPKARLKEIKTEKQKIAEFLIDEFDCIHCDMCDAKHCRECCKKSHWKLSRDYAGRIAEEIMEIVNE